MATETHYEVLGIAPTASPAEIASAYHRLARLLHPDVGGTGALFHRVNTAYETLRDPLRRSAYDRSLRAPAGPGAPGGGGPAGSDRADGWVRVDEPAPGWAPHPEAGGSGPQGAPDGPGWSSPPTSSGAWSSRSSRAGWFGAAQPWQVVLLAGFALALLLPSLGLPVILLGAIAGVGARRAHRREALRAAGFATVDAMDPTTFEHYVGECLRAGGGRVRHVGGTGDFGADLLLERAGRRTVVQVKRYTQSVGVAAVQQTAAARAHYGADSAMVVTNSWFTPAARQLAASNRVELWDRHALAEAASQARMLPFHSPVRRFGSELVAGLGVLARWLLMGAGALAVLTVVSGTGAHRRRRRTHR